MPWLMFVEFQVHNYDSHTVLVETFHEFLSNLNISRLVLGVVFAQPIEAGN